MRVNQPVYKEFVTRSRQYVLVSSCNEEVMAYYGGESIRIPPQDKVLKGSGDKNPMVIDGEEIPGTVVIQDRYDYDPVAGTTNLGWDVSMAIRHILGIDAGSGEAKGTYAKRGISLASIDATKQDIDDIKNAGRVRWMAWQVDEARQSIAEFEGRNKVRKMMGLNEIPLTSEYQEAVAILDAHAEKIQDRAAKAIQETISTLGAPKPPQVARAL